MRLRSASGTRKARFPGRAAMAVLGAFVLGLDPAGPAAARAAESTWTDRVTALAVSPPDDTLWVATARGLFRSGDHGRTRAPVTLPVREPIAEVTAVVVEPRAPWTVYVGTAHEGIFTSEDAGATWAAANSGLTSLDIRGLALAPPDGRLHAQVQGKGLFRSPAGARDWTWVNAGSRGTLRALVSINIPTGMGGIFLYAVTDQGRSGARTVSEGGQPWAVCPRRDRSRRLRAIRARIPRCGRRCRTACGGAATAVIPGLGWRRPRPGSRR